MSNVVGIDAKEYNRPKIIRIEAPAASGNFVEKDVGFHSVIGVAAEINDYEKFIEAYKKATNDIIKGEDMVTPLTYLSSFQMKETIWKERAIYTAREHHVDILSSLFKKVEDYISKLHFVFTILPPTTIPTIRIGGFRCPLRDLETNLFLRRIVPSFSHIVAWSYGKKHGHDSHFYIDAFTSKKTKAWDTLINNADFSVVFHGDECNPAISLADLILYYTDTQLFLQKGLKLNPSDIESLWSDYDFEVDSYIISSKNLQMITWNAKEDIDIWPYVVKPVVFFRYAYPEQTGQSRPKTVSPTPPEEELLPDTWREFIGPKIFPIVLRLAQDVNGSCKNFQDSSDLNHVADGDYFVYVGEPSRQLGLTLETMYDVRIISVRELREGQKKKGSH